MLPIPFLLPVTVIASKHAIQLGGEIAASRREYESRSQIKHSNTTNSYSIPTGSRFNVPVDSSVRNSIDNVLALADAEWTNHMENRHSILPISNKSDIVADIWKRYQPAWACPTLDRLGPLSEGGKWVCGIRAMALASIKDHRPCNIYSFGISNDVRFEQALMHQLEATAPGSCTLHMFDPTIQRLPRDQKIVGNHTFEKIGLGSRTGIHNENVTEASDAEASDKWREFTLRDLLARDKMAKADLLKIDIEGAEFDSFLDDLCSTLSIEEPMPFDQLLIELHRPPPRRPPRSNMIDFFTCLEERGFVSFSREPNLHGCACNGHPLWTIEYSFVRRKSVFTGEMAVRAAIGGSMSFNSSLTTSSSREKQSNLSWTDIFQWAEAEYVKAIRRRELYVMQTYARPIRVRGRGIKHPRGIEHLRGTKASDLGRNKSKEESGWSKMLPWRCSMRPAYLWDLFEPRFPCPMRRFSTKSEAANSLHTLSCIRKHESFDLANNERRFLSLRSEKSAEILEPNVIEASQMKKQQKNKKKRKMRKNNPTIIPNLSNIMISTRTKVADIRPNAGTELKILRQQESHSGGTTVRGSLSTGISGPSDSHAREELLSPVIKHYILKESSDWATFSKACYDGIFHKHSIDEIIIHMDLTRLVKEPSEWKQNSKAFSQTLGESGPVVALSQIVRCLENHNFRLFGNEVEAQECETKIGRANNAPRAAVVGFVHRDSPWLQYLPRATTEV